MLRRIFSAILLIVMVAANISLAVAQTANTGSTVQQVETKGTSRPSSPATNVELLLLREQNRMTAVYQSSLLDTVYWALGGIVGLAILLSGYSWWSNNQLYEKDKKRLQDEFDAKLGAVSSRYEQRLIEVRQATELAAHLAVSSEVSAIRSETTALRTKIYEQTNLLQETRVQLAEAIKSVERDLADGEAQLRFVEEYVWSARGNFYNVVLTQSQGIRAALEAQNESYVERVLRRMKETVEKELIPQGRKFDDKSLDLITEPLRDVDGEHNIIIGEILELLKKVKDSEQERG